MKAMVLNRIRDLNVDTAPLELIDLPVPMPGERDIRLKVSCCGVCHTELDEIEGRTLPPRLPVIPGHQVVGRVESVGKQVSDVNIGDRMGVAWIFSACGRCKFCLAGSENLCPEFQATGRDANGGYAQYMVVARNLPMPYRKYSPMRKLRPCFAPGQSATGHYG
jgi:alcohol dehydrogenase, propanol-preferring